MKGMKTFLHKLLATIWLLVFGINCSDAGIASTFGYTREIQGQIEYDAPHMGIFGYDGAVMHTANECVGQLANERPVFAPFSNSFAADTTTVGRWMSQDEFEAMQSSQTVQAPLNGAGATHVTVPPNPAAFTPQPSSGSVFVQFDVPSSQLNLSDPSQGWGRVFGPGSLEARYATWKGLPVPTQMPPAFNIQQTASQWPK